MALKETRIDLLQLPKSSNLKVVNPKNTSQESPLEGLLTYLRTRKVAPHVRGKVVLDFGCGEHLRTLRSLAKDLRRGYGYDILFQELPPQQTEDGFNIYGRLIDIPEDIDCITSLACFEHIESSELPVVLRELSQHTPQHTIILGTVPTPPAKPVLEFLSYKLGLIDASQVRDHRIYYDKSNLAEVVVQGGWSLAAYRTFQFGMNSFFRLEKCVL